MKSVAQIVTSAFAGAGLLTALGCEKATPDEAALRALDAAYVEAWLTEDAEQQEKEVLALFDADAAIMPGGMPPEDGIRNLKKFWFPDDSAPTTVTHFTHEIESVDIAPPVGVVSGTYTLSFTYGGEAVTQAGNYLFVARESLGGWKIQRMIWNDQPLTDV